MDNQTTRRHGQESSSNGLFVISPQIRHSQLLCILSGRNPSPHCLRRGGETVPGCKGAGRPLLEVRSSLLRGQSGGTAGEGVTALGVTCGQLGKGGRDPLSGLEGDTGNGDREGR